MRIHVLSHDDAEPGDAELSEEYFDKHHVCGGEGWFVARFRIPTAGFNMSIDYKLLLNDYDANRKVNFINKVGREDCMFCVKFGKDNPVSSDIDNHRNINNMTTSYTLRYCHEKDMFGVGVSTSAMSHVALFRISYSEYKSKIDDFIESLRYDDSWIEIPPSPPKRIIDVGSVDDKTYRNLFDVIRSFVCKTCPNNMGTNVYVERYGREWHHVRLIIITSDICMYQISPCSFPTKDANIELMCTLTKLRECINTPFRPEDKAAFRFEAWKEFIVTREGNLIIRNTVGGDVDTSVVVHYPSHRKNINLFIDMWMQGVQGLINQ
jgi:hypothetical protein